MITPPFDRSRLDGVLAPIAQAHGAEIVDVELKSEGQGWVLRVFVEKLGSAENKATTFDAAVNLEICSNVARELSPALDVADLLPHRYHLEVSSPGLERALKTLADYDRFVGEGAKLKFVEPVRGQKAARIKLRGTREDHVLLDDGKEEFSVPLSNIVSGHLVYEFRAAAKPGKTQTLSNHTHPHKIASPANNNSGKTKSGKNKKSR
jgi:ribosome maturation factor RimP